MKNYLEKLDPMIKEYFKILSDDFPEFLLEYIETPRMQKQDGISVSCGFRSQCCSCTNYLEFYT